MNKGAICENWEASKRALPGREMVKSGHRGITGGSGKERLWHSKKQVTLDSVKLSKSSSWDRIVDPSVFSYTLKELRLQIKTEDYMCLHYVSGVCETVQSHSP